MKDNRWDPPDIVAKHKIVATLLALGKTNKEIAEIVGFTPGTIAKWKKSGKFRLMLAEAEQELRSKLFEKAISLHEQFDIMAPRAAEIMEALMDHAETDNVRFNAARDILDRAPSAPKSQKHIEEKTSTHLHLSLKVTECMREAIEDVEEADIVELIGDDHGKSDEIIVISLDGDDDE